MQEKLGTKEGIKKGERSGAGTRVSGVNRAAQQRVSLRGRVQRQMRRCFSAFLSLRQHDPTPLQL